MKICATRKLLLVLSDMFEIKSVEINLSINVWYALSFTYSRKKFMMVTNAFSLYTIFIPVGTKHERRSLLTNFRSELFKRLTDDYGEDASLKTFKMLELDEISIVTKTSNRRILGSMNDFKSMISYLDSNIDNVDITSQMSGITNHSPMSYIDMKSPRAAMKSILFFES